MNKPIYKKTLMCAFFIGSTINLKKTFCWSKIASSSSSADYIKPEGNRGDPFSIIYKVFS